MKLKNSSKIYTFVHNNSRVVLMILILLFLPIIALSQEAKQKKLNSNQLIKTDSLQSESPSLQPKKPEPFKMPSQEQVKQVQDSIVFSKSPSGLDSAVTFFARDTMIFDVKKQVMMLKGNATLDYKSQGLKADYIQVSFKESLLKAKAGTDSAGKKIGFPEFIDNGESFNGEEINYNFKTNKGLISAGETQMGEGFYYGDKIKRISDVELFVCDGYYTTCDHPKSHYHFGSPEMKVVAKDRVFLDPLIFYVEDMPIFAIPFGLFFPSQSGRKSGIIVPSFYFSKNRGVVFQDFGFYWAASDYWDTQIKTDIYTKGGYLIKNRTAWVLRDVFSGYFDLQYGNTRYNPDDRYTTNWSFAMRHNHSLTPYERIDVNTNFTSSNFYQNTSTNVTQRVQQNITSNAAYSKSFENGTNFSISYQRDQNIINKEYSQSIPITYSVPNFYPLRKVLDIKSDSWFSWVKDVSMTYSGGANYYNDKRLKYNSQGQLDTNGANKFTNSTRRWISHQPGISISPKFGFFTISPSFGFGANNYFRRINKTFNPSDSSVTETEESGFFTEYWWNFGLRASTTLYGVIDDKKRIFGIISPQMFGVKAMRHVYQPSLGFNFTPDFSSEKFNFYGRYKNAKGEEIEYSRFMNDGGMHAPSNLSKTLTYSDNHRFEMKIAQGDSLDDKNVELLNLSFNGSYNFAADSLNLSEIGVSFRTPAIGFLNFSGNASFTPYDEVKIQTSPTSFVGRRINKYLMTEGKGLARLSSVNISFSTSFSSNGVVVDNPDFEESRRKKKSAIKDTVIVGLGERFNARNQEEEPFDLFGDSTPGYSEFDLPWSINLNASFSYNRYSVYQPITRNLNLTAFLNLTLTKTWKANLSMQYDFIENRMLTPQINISKQMHCWELMFTWTPTGFNRGFYLKFGILSSMLEDLKIEKRSSPIFR